MFKLTEAAKEQLEGYFKDKEISPFRVYLAAGGCSGPQLTLALDTPNDTDEAHEAGGFTFLVEKELQAQTGKIEVDMTHYGFVVTSENPIGGGGGCCSSSGCGSAGGGCSSSGCGC